jgi:hypothetical protein
LYVLFIFIYISESVRMKWKRRLNMPWHGERIFLSHEGTNGGVVVKFRGNFMSVRLFPCLRREMRGAGAAERAG